MKLTKAVIEQTKVRLLAKEFIKTVRGSNMAFKIPDETIDAVPDKYVEHFKQVLKEYRIVQRLDGLWEEKK